MGTLKNLGLVLLVLAVFIVAAAACFGAMRKYLHDLRELYFIVRSGAPAKRIAKNRIVWLLAIGVIALTVAFPAFDRMERKSPLHVVVKPAAEAAIRANNDARDLVGEPMSFGKEESWSYSSESGDMSFQLVGSRAKGDVHVTAKAVDGVWQPTSITLRVADKSLSITE